MTTISKAESKRMYSWWWDSHISPKNSKWLQDNLTDMDSKVKSMIKLIEEDADSFARRAEMYYKKRPELMKLVEEFYRAYRALAERYDHATGALQQAQKTMSEAFPNQIPFALSDESSSASTSADMEPSTPVKPPMSFASGSDELPKDFSSPSPFHAKRNGTYSVDGDPVIGKKGLKELTDFFSDNHTRKGSKFQEEESKESANEDRKELKGFRKNGMHAEVSQKVKKLQEEISQLSEENQGLKMQIKSESRNQSRAESELQWLAKSHSQLKSEREEAVQNFQLSLRRITALEAEIENFKTQSSEMLENIANLESTEEKSMLSEKEKISLQLQVETMEQKLNKQEEALVHKEEELEKLKIAIKDEHMRCVHAEASLESLQTLHTQSVEALEISALEIQNGVQLLKETETKKESLEKELQNAKMEIQNLNDENVCSQQLIKTLQDDISVLKDAQKKLENEVELESNVKKCLDQELYHLKEEISDVLQNHKSITDQIEAVGLNKESLQSSVKALQDANLELKDLFKKKEDENVLLLQKLEKMQEISERNALLENSLSVANIELDVLRANIKALQESYELLNEKNSFLESEKAAQVSKVEAVMARITELSERDTLLERSLSDAVVELEELGGRMKSLEEYCQSLEEDKANLQIENKTLVSQVESLGNNLEDLRKMFKELHNKNSHLEKEKKIKENESTELQTLFDIKRQQYEAYMDASNVRLSALESEICRLQQDNSNREEEFMEEQHKFIAAQLEIFIFQKSIHDLKERNFILSKEWQKMENYILGQQEKEITLLDRIERLKKVIHMIWRAISTNEDCILMDGSEELSLQFILDKIKGMQNTARDAEDERQSLCLEKSVYVALLQQLGQHIMDLRLEKKDLYQECKKKTDELLILENEKRDLMELNSQLKYESEAGWKRVETLEEEMKILDKQTLDLKEAHSMSQDENQKLLEKNGFLYSKFSNLREEMHLLEEEYSAIFERAAVLDSLSLVFEQLSSDNIADLKALNKDLTFSHKISDDLEGKVMKLAEKSELVETENMHLKNLASRFEECRERLTILAVDMGLAKTVNEELSSQIEQLDQLTESRNSLLNQKDMALSETDLNLQNLQKQNIRLNGNLEDIKLELGEIRVVRNGLERNIETFLKNMAKKEKEIACALEANEILGKKLQRLSKENGDLRMKKRESTTVLLNEVKCCEEEFAGLCKDIQVANVHAALFEGKVLELLRECESLETRNLVEREASNEEVLSKSAQIEELHARLESLEGEKRVMKAELNEYISIVSSLGNSISSLEKLIISPKKHHTSNNLKKQDDCAKSLAQGTDRVEPSNDQQREVPQGVLELQKLLDKVETLREVVVKSGGHLTLSESAGGASKMVDTNFYDSGATSRKKHASMSDSRASTSKDELMMKDIQLDHLSSSSKYDFDDDACEIGNTKNIEKDDKMLRLWETTERDSSQNQNPPSTTSMDDANHHLGIKALEEKESDYYPSSELAAEKELGIDKLEVPKKGKDFRHSWNKEVVERLSSDSERLTALQKDAEELKMKMERSEEQNIPKSFEFDTIKMQLQDAEATIVKLVETNRKLIKKAQDCSLSSCSSIEEMDETKDMKKIKVSERARRGSDKIGRVELELRKLQYISLKLEEEYQNDRRRATDRSSKVLLKDYLYGKKEKRRKRSLLSCVGLPM